MTKAQYIIQFKVLILKFFTNQKNENKMNKILTLLAGLFCSASIYAQTDIFFSEYVEGSENNKALEIYNPTNAPVDLSSYYIARYSNGETTYTKGGVTQLKGVLQPDSAFVFVNGQTSSTETSPATSAALQALADQLDGAYPAPTYMNGNDAIALLKATDGNLASAIPVDLIGQIGLLSQISAEEGWAPFSDTIVSYIIDNVSYKHTIKNYIIKSTDDTKKASYGPYWLAWTQDHTLRRKYNIVSGVKANPAGFNPSLEWDTVSISTSYIDTVTNETKYKQQYKDIWDGLGKHSCVAHSGVGNHQLKTAKLQVYPTLIKNQKFTVNSEEPVSSIAIFNSIGQLVQTMKYSNAAKQFEVQIPELKKGMYLVKFETSGSYPKTVKITVN